MSTAIPSKGCPKSEKGQRSVRFDFLGSLGCVHELAWSGAEGAAGRARRRPVRSLGVREGWSESLASAAPFDRTGVFEKFPLPIGLPACVLVHSTHAKDEKIRRQALQTYRSR